MDTWRKTDAAHYAAPQRPARRDGHARDYVNIVRAQQYALNLAQVIKVDMKGTDVCRNEPIHLSKLGATQLCRLRMCPRGHHHQAIEFMKPQQNNAALHAVSKKHACAREWTRAFSLLTVSRYWTTLS